MNWQRSTFCDRDQPMCVEVKKDHDGRILIRDDQFNDLPIVTDRESFGALVAGIKAGEFDDLI